MINEEMVHSVILEYVRHRLSRDYKEIEVNPGGDPDLRLSNHGLVLAVVEIETEHSITPQKAEKWRDLAGSGPKLILVVPKGSRVKVMELLWHKGIADKVGVGTYDIALAMP